MHNKNGMEGGLTLDTLSSYCDTNPVALSWLAFYDDCEGQVRFGIRGARYTVQREHTKSMANRNAR